MEWVWSMWGWVWPTPFNANKFKVDLKTCIIRTNLHKLKLQELVQKEKGEVLELIRNNKTELAKIKVESIIHHYRKISGYDIVTNYCESLSSRIDLLQTASGDTPSEVLGAIHTLVYASVRLNVPELKELASQIRGKFGYSIGDNLLESSVIWIDKRIIEYLSLDPPEEEIINKYLQEFFGQVKFSEVSSPSSARLSKLTNPSREAEDHNYNYQIYPTPSPVHNYQPYISSPMAPPQFTYSAMPASFPSTPTTPSSYPAFSPPVTPSAPNDSRLSFSTPPYTPTTPLYPDPSTPSPSPSSFIDPSFLYSSPSTTYASAPFASPPPENPEYTAHAAASKTSSVSEFGATISKKNSPSIKKETDRTRNSLKKRPTKIRKARKSVSNPFQQGAVKSPIKQEELVYYDSSDEEFVHKHNKEQEDQKNREGKTSEDEEIMGDLNARLEALKRMQQ